MSLVMPEAAATSSIDVAANPVRANAVAAPRRMDAARSARGSSTRGAAGGDGGTTCQVYTQEYTPVDDLVADGLVRARAAGEPPLRRAAVRRGDPLPRGLRRRRLLRVASHPQPGAR